MSSTQAIRQHIISEPKPAAKDTKTKSVPAKKITPYEEPPIHDIPLEEPPEYIDDFDEYYPGGYAQPAEPVPQATAPAVPKAKPKNIAPAESASKADVPAQTKPLAAEPASPKKRGRPAGSKKVLNADGVAPSAADTKSRAPRRNDKIAVIDDKIAKLEDTAAKAKEKYDKANEEIAELKLKKTELQKEGIGDIMDAIGPTDRSFEEIIKFLKG